MAVGVEVAVAVGVEVAVAVGVTVAVAVGVEVAVAVGVGVGVGGLHLPALPGSTMAEISAAVSARSKNLTSSIAP